MAALEPVLCEICESVKVRFLNLMLCPNGALAFPEHPRVPELVELHRIAAAQIQHAFEDEEEHSDDDDEAATSQVG